MGVLFAGAGVPGRRWYSRVCLLQEVSPLETEFHVVVGSPSNKMSVMDLQELYVRTVSVGVWLSI
jgi:hypothetical protein